MASSLLMFLGGIIGIGFLGNLLFEKTRVPDVLVLIGVGVILGPVLQLVPTETLHPFMSAFGTIALTIILFEGGLDLDLQHTLAQSGRSVLLACLSFALALLLIYYALLLGLNVPGRSAWAMAAALACTSGPIVIPILARLAPRSPMRPLLAVESAFSDALSVITVLILLRFDQGELSLSLFSAQLATSLLIGSGAALVGGLLWLWLLSHLSRRPFFYLMTLGFVFLLLGVVEHFHGSGALGVLVFGMVLANGEALAGLFSRRTRDLIAQQFGSGHLGLHPRITESHAEVSFLTRGFFFVYLGLIFRWPGADVQLWLAIVLVTVAIVVGREIAVQLTGWTMRVPAADRSLLAAMLPRGLATAVLASILAAQSSPSGPSWESLATFVIVITNVWMTLRLFKIQKETAARVEEKS